MKINIGVIGLGRRGRKLIDRNILSIPGYNITSICDRHTELINQTIEETGIGDVKTYTDYRKMLEDTELDAVFVAADPCSQTELVCASLDSGKHTICEVPLAYSIKDCWDVVISAERSGKKFLMAEQVRYSDFALKAQEMNRKKEFGKILYVEGQYIHAASYHRTHWDVEKGVHLSIEQARDNPNAIVSNRIPLHAITYCPHELSPILKILDDRIDTISCMRTRPVSYIHDTLNKSDVEIAIMHTKKDTILRIHNSFSVPSPKSRQHWYQIFGTEGQTEMPRAKWDSGKLWLSKNKEDDYEKIEGNMWNADVNADKKHFGLDRYPFENFIKVLTEGAEPDMDVYDAAHITAAGVVAGISSEYDGLPFRVPDFKPGKDRKIGEYPSSLKARSLYGDIEREGYLIARDGKLVELKEEL